MNNDIVPPYVLKNMNIKTTREFKSRKRKELREIKKAVSEYHRGCAYTPGYDEINELDKLLNKIQTMQSIKEWGN